MTILSWIVLGIVVGGLARWIVPGEGPVGLAGDLLGGVAGSLAGGWIFSLFGHTMALTPSSFICALIGSVVLLRAIHAIGARRTSA